jgi:stage II sporulation protein D
LVAGDADGKFHVVDEEGSAVWQGRGPLRVEARGSRHLRAGDLKVRGSLEISARQDSLFVVNVVPLEEYLRGVVPLEIGPRPAEDLDAVAAQAVAARTYTARRLEQYTSLPFDLFASVQDQVYAGVEVENAVADEAIRKTRGMILADRDGLVEAFYSSTCGGRRSDIAAVWPHREVNGALRGGSDGSRGREWCRSSRHFEWRESWSGAELSALVRKHLGVVLELPPGSVQGELVDLKVVKRGPSGRIAILEYRTESSSFRVPGDRNRWILRRSDGSILRSVLVELNVRREGGRVVEVVAEGRGNGHGVGMCQVGALGRAEAGQAWWEILRAYYPGARVRPLRSGDLPPGRDAGA